MPKQRWKIGMDMLLDVQVEKMDERVKFGIHKRRHWKPCVMTFKARGYDLTAKQLSARWRLTHAYLPK